MLYTRARCVMDEGRLPTLSQLRLHPTCTGGEQCDVRGNHGALQVRCREAPRRKMFSSSSRELY